MWTRGNDEWRTCQKCAICCGDYMNARLHLWQEHTEHEVCGCPPVGPVIPRGALSGYNQCCELLPCSVRAYRSTSYLLPHVHGLSCCLCSNIKPRCDQHHGCKSSFASNPFSVLYTSFRRTQLLLCITTITHTRNTMNTTQNIAGRRTYTCTRRRADLSKTFHGEYLTDCSKR